MYAFRGLVAPPGVPNFKECVSQSYYKYHSLKNFHNLRELLISEAIFKKNYDNLRSFL